MGSTALVPAPRTAKPVAPRAVPSRGERMRATLLLGGLVVPLVLLGGRLYDVQVKRHDHYKDLALKQQHRWRTQLPGRGDILMQESQGTVAVAASVERGSLMVESFKAKNPGEERDADAFVERLSGAIDLTPLERRFLEDRLDENRPFFFRRRRLSPEDMDALRALSLPGAQVVDEPVRSYPFSSLGIQVLGLLTAEGAGASGVERTFDDQLRGIRGLREVELDNGGWARKEGHGPSRRELVDPAGVDVRARNGLSVVLTLDRRIQGIVEEEIDRLCEAWQPKGAAVVVVDPRNGNVLAVATRPTFSPDAIAKAPKEAFKNRALSDTYEPGSTIKPLVVGTAWDAGLGDPERAIFCPRVYHLPGRKKAIEDVHEVGATNEAGVLVMSSNAGAVQIANRLGMARLRRALEAFGLGKVSGIDLPAEASGNARALAKSDQTTLGSIGQGYALTVTPLQMALAYAAIGNGGTLYRPRVVAELRNADGETARRFEPVPVARVLSAHVAKDWLAPALERVVSDPHGTAHACKVPGYTLAGKTGTTKKIVGGHYSEREAITSFCGFAPHDDPRIALCVVCFEPSTSKGKVWGGTVAAPCASAIVGKTLKYLGLPQKVEEPEKKEKHEAD